MTLRSSKPFGKRSVLSSILPLVLFGWLFFEPSATFGAEKAQSAANALTIYHAPSNNEEVLIFWFAPPAVPESIEGSFELRSFLNRYVVIGFNHITLSESGAVEIKRQGDPDLFTEDGTELALIPENTMPKELLDALKLIREKFSSSFNGAGKSMRWLLHERSGVRACDIGELTIRYLDEVFYIATPVSGC